MIKRTVSHHKAQGSWKIQDFFWRTDLTLPSSVDVSGLEDGEKVRYSQEKVVQALQEYTLSHYPHLPPKFGELLLRIPELQRTCQVSS